ncbi:MAG: TIGR03032 family protein [Isosphaeraceae bacterium]
MEAENSTKAAQRSASFGEVTEPPARRDFRCAYSQNLGAILNQLRATLLISSYHVGELVVVGASSQGLELSFHHFERAMGIAVRRDRIAVGTQTAVWFLPRVDEISERLEPKGRYDACFLARSARFTGEILSHELAWSGEELWVVNTRFSCLCTFDDRHSFVPRWRPKFITALAAEDRCHLNGLAMSEGRPRLVTALAETDVAEGWRPNKATSGCVIDVQSNETAIRGLAMPHSPRIYEGRFWLLDSGRGRLVLADLARGAVETVAELPGYARGLAMFGSLAFVGLSKLRKTNLNTAGVPIASQSESLKSGVAVVDLTSGRQLALLEFQSGIEEVFDVQVLPGVRSPLISGPNPQIDSRAVWFVP